MADSSNTQVPPATSPAPVQEGPRRPWVVPLVAGLAVVAALALGGVGGYTLAHATDARGPAVIQTGPQRDVPPGPHGPDDRRGPRGERPGPDDRPAPGDRPERPNGDNTENEGGDSER